MQTLILPQPQQAVAPQVAPVQQMEREEEESEQSEPMAQEEEEVLKAPSEDMGERGIDGSKLPCF